MPRWPETKRLGWRESAGGEIDSRGAIWHRQEGGDGEVEVTMQTELDALKKRLYGGDRKAKNVKFFPGRDNDATPEDIARMINMFFADPTKDEDQLDLD